MTHPRMHPTYTTCRTCGDQLVFGPPEHEQPHLTHVGCKRTRQEDLAAEYLGAIHRGDTAAKRRIETELDRLDEQAERRDLRRAALTYARDYGWPVFPLRPGDKNPITKHGFENASTDPEQIERWWRAVPQANIGVPTGIRFDVLDVDWRAKKTGAPSGAHETWPKLRDSGALPPIHGRVLTARSGLHIYLEPTGDGGHVRMAPGLDYRGRGGYVVVPPSRMPIRDGAGRTITGLWSWSIYPSPALTGRGTKLTLVENTDGTDGTDPIPVAS